MPTPLENKNQPIELGKGEGFNPSADEKEAEKAVGSKQKATMAKRIQEQKGGEWIRYWDSMAERLGAYYSITIVPITYSFQKGYKTFVLDEHVPHIVDIFEQRIRAKGDKIDKTNIFGDVDPSKMINGGSIR